MPRPNFYWEKKEWKKGYLVIGVDEVGRGALAGPLVVGAVIFSNPYQTDSPASFIKKIESFGINDSKKLSAKKRKILAKVIKKNCLAWAVSVVSVRFINNHGIGVAFQKGVRDILRKLEISPAAPGRFKSKIYLLIDGFYVKCLRGIGLRNQKAIVGGDEKSISIAAASIIVKVYRDQLMGRLAKKYPKYHWEKNKGYGTKEHLKALKKYGKTKFHRDLFIRKIL